MLLGRQENTRAKYQNGTIQDTRKVSFFIATRKGKQQMSKFVCHAEKVKMNSVSGLERHCERKNKNYSNEFVDLSLSDNNIYLHDNDGKPYLQIVKDRIAGRYNPTGRALRKDAVAMVDFIVSSDRKFFKDMPREDMIDYFQICKDFLSELFGNDTLVYAVIHMDETTPHLHIGFVPMTKDNRLCAKDIINRESLCMIQDKLPALLRENGFSIEKGEANSDAVHKSDRAFKADMERQVDKLSKEKQRQAKVLSDITKSLKDIGNINEIETGTTFFNDRITLDKKDYKKLKSTAIAEAAAVPRIKQLERENTDLRKQLEAEKEKNKRSIRKSLNGAAGIREAQKYKEKYEKALEIIKENGLSECLSSRLSARKMQAKPKKRGDVYHADS